MQKEPTGLTDVYLLLQQVMLDHLLHLLYDFLLRYAEPQLLFLPEFVKQESLESILNVACRGGEWTCEFARRYPNIHVIGVDSRRSSVRDAQMIAAVRGLENASFFER